MMLSKVFEWTRAVHPTPDDAFVEKRTAVITALVEEFSKKTGLLADCACFAAAGQAARFTQESDLVVALISAIRTEQPAFPEALSENALELRVCCCLVIGEISERAATGKNFPSQNSQVAASMVVSGLANRTIGGGKHLQTMLQELLTVAAGVLKRAGDLQRRRSPLPPLIESVEAGGDHNALWTAAKPALVKLANAAEANAGIDREEINTLWWAFNGVSSTKDAPLAALPVAEAAMRAGLELANLVLVPPLATTKFLVRRVLAAGRPEPDLKASPLKDFIESWDAPNASSLLSKNAKVLDLVRANPGIYPISWCLLKISEGGGNAVAEVKKHVGSTVGIKVSPEWLAHQVFDERVSQRLYQNLAG